MTPAIDTESLNKKGTHFLISKFEIGFSALPFVYCFIAWDSVRTP
jgi:hypothetical protein